MLGHSVAALSKLLFMLSSFRPFDYTALIKARWLKQLRGGRTVDYLPKPLMVRSPDGLTWIWRPKSSDALAWASHEPLLTSIFQALVGMDTVFYDIGAHVGRYTVRAAARGAKVVAFEPNPLNAQGLWTNVRLNGMSHKVSLVRAAVSDKTEWLTLYENGASSSVIRPRNKSACYKVKCYALDDLIGRLPPPTLIKIDVEGHELKVLSGAKETLDRYRPTLVVEVHRAYGVETSQVAARLPGHYGVKRFLTLGKQDYLLALPSSSANRKLLRVITNVSATI